PRLNVPRLVVGGCPQLAPTCPASTCPDSRSVGVLDLPRLNVPRLVVGGCPQLAPQLALPSIFARVQD
ncbi:MAG: hypothetical protein QMB94_09410, partial [Phycisphaerales bacterium]